MKDYMLTTRSVKKRGSIRILHRNKKSGGGGEKEKSGVAKRGDDELFLRAHEKKQPHSSGSLYCLVYTTCKI